MSFELLVSYALNLFNFVIVLGVAVLIHEAGHFIVARLSGIRVEKFSIGFGKPLFSFKRGHTEYIIAPIPMGGYVKMAGDNPAEVTGEAYEFYSISPWKRIPTVLAGPGANIIGAFTIFFCLAFLVGERYRPNVIGEVLPGCIGEQAGLRENDVLLAADGVALSSWEELQEVLTEAYANKKEEVALTVQRATETLEVRVPTSAEALDQSLVVAFVDPTGPAFTLGMREGDRVVSIDGIQTDTWSAFSSKAKSLWDATSAGPVAKTTTLVWAKANGGIESASVTPEIVLSSTGETIALLGLGHAEMGISPKVPPIVDRVLRDFPAREAGIEPGAEIIALDGELVDNSSVIPRTIAYHYKPAPPGSDEEVVAIPMEVTWRNPGEEELRTETLTPVITKSVIDSQIGIQLAKRFYYGQLGITFAEPKRRLGLVASLGEAVEQTNRAWEETVRILKGLFTGQVNHKLIGGPVAIFQLSAQVGREGMVRLLWFCAFLQVNLALLNLLPIPILDGGHIVVSVAEGISRRTFTLKQREYIQYIGAAFLFPLFAFVFYNDFARLGLFDWIGGIFG